MSSPAALRQEPLAILQARRRHLEAHRRRRVGRLERLQQRRSGRRVANLAHRGTGHELIDRWEKQLSVVVVGYGPTAGGIVDVPCDWEIGSGSLDQANGANIVLPGASRNFAGLSPGVHKFECLIHPWMRLEVEVRKEKDHDR